MSRPLSKLEIESLAVNASDWLQDILARGEAMPTSEWQDRRLMRVRESMSECGMSRSQWYRLVQVGDAPPPIRTGTKMSRWIAGETFAYRDIVIHRARQPASKPHKRIPQVEQHGEAK